MGQLSDAQLGHLS